MNWLLSVTAFQLPNAPPSTESFLSVDASHTLWFHVIWVGYIIDLKFLLIELQLSIYTLLFVLRFLDDVLHPNHSVLAWLMEILYAARHMRA